ncbi:Uncharacterised protein [Chlamydia trachomatis]|nr:Uncharacterised protein [Chlamydia trachomatis]
MGKLDVVNVDDDVDFDDFDLQYEKFFIPTSIDNVVLCF